MSPKAFDEAAEIDGAGELKIFFNINIPLAGGAILTTFFLIKVKKEIIDKLGTNE